MEHRLQFAGSGDAAGTASSMAQLSGGQRSLLSLALILAVSIELEMVCRQPFNAGSPVISRELMASGTP